ncbi:MAG: hypothetical protein GX413_13675 [Acetobacter sp.]|nr:hypothetical protein [Acetobacter sp.]
MSETSLHATATRPMRIFIGGSEVTNWTSLECGRDLADICGVFRVEIDDAARDDAAGFSSGSSATLIREHMDVEIRVHETVVFRGWVDDIDLRVEDGHASGVASGRDRAGDLVDCTGNPVGPAEYRQIHLMDVIGSLVKPFGLSIDSDVDTGAPFTLVALDVEPVMSTIEKLSRQRGVLVVSDGVGGIRLTQAGVTRAPGSLTFPGNVQSIEARISVQDHYSDIWVKGAFRSVLRPSSGTLKAGGAPADAPLSAGGISFSEQESRSVVRYGHAVDPSVPRYRPRVWLAATQSGGSETTQNAGNPPLDADVAGYLKSQGLNPTAYHASARSKKRKPSKHRSSPSAPWTLQDQAGWRMRTTRAHGTARVYTVPGLTTNDELWKPNTLVAVTDEYSGIYGDMLIAAVTWVADDQGYRTRLSLVSTDAFDIKEDAAGQKPGRRKSGHISGWDGSRS